ncbi:hypothetical protein [Streptomyces sp. NPDC048438]|uniref:hypothetical protein n=1 Tax=Streptomyces sp. NPDC048438 TaxID=3365551 RepID=UPI003714D401
MAKVELAIDQVTIVNPVEATAAVRCILGPLRRSARFSRIPDSAETTDLELTSYGWIVASATPRRWTSVCGSRCQRGGHPSQAIG